MFIPLVLYAVMYDHRVPTRVRCFRWCVTSQLLCTPVEFRDFFFFFFISAKSSQLLHPVLYSTNTHIKHTHTHTHTRQLHRRLWNSLLPWQWNRARSLALPVLFYCFISPLSLALPLSLYVEANPLLLFDMGLVFAAGIRF